MVTSLAIGYQLGSRSQISASRTSVTPVPDVKQPAVVPLEVQPEEEDADVEDEDDDEDLADGNLADITAGFMEPCKMVCTLFGALTRI